MILNIVDFPTPLGPKDQEFDPHFKLKLMFSKTLLFLNDKEIFSNLIMGFFL